MYNDIIVLSLSSNHKRNIKWITQTIIYHIGQSVKSLIKVPIYYFVDDEGKIVVDEECMSEEFNEKLLKVSSILNGKKEGK